MNIHSDFNKNGYWSFNAIILLTSWHPTRKLVKYTCDHASFTKY